MLIKTRTPPRKIAGMEGGKRLVFFLGIERSELVGRRVLCYTYAYLSTSYVRHVVNRVRWVILGGCGGGGVVGGRERGGEGGWRMKSFKGFRRRGGVWTLGGGGLIFLWFFFSFFHLRKERVVTESFNPSPFPPSLPPLLSFSGPLF